MADTVCQRGMWALLWAIIGLLVQGCVSVPERTRIPEEVYPDSRVLGMTGLRFWGDEMLPIAVGLPGDLSMDELKEIFPGLVGRELNFLAISGGGANGAFAAGLLNAWTDSGTRPEFNIVTGISTGITVTVYYFTFFCSLL